MTEHTSTTALGGSTSESERNHYYGKDCPVGMVQVEFVGCPPNEKRGEYGWRPVKSAFLEVYVDGHRFRIDVGTFHDGVAERRGLYVIGPIGMRVDQPSINAASVFIVEASSLAPAARETQETNDG